jgi:hypothetical protein
MATYVRNYYLGIYDVGYVGHVVSPMIYAIATLYVTILTMIVTRDLIRWGRVSTRRERYTVLCLYLCLVGLWGCITFL